MIKTYEIERSRDQNQVAEHVAYLQIDAEGKVDARRDVFVARVTFMLGDADGYPVEEVVFPGTDREALVDFLNFLTRCAVRYPNGKCGYDTYEDVPGYSKWVDGQCNNSPRLSHWPCEYEEFPGDFDSVVVTYIDLNGKSFPVQMVLDR